MPLPCYAAAAADAALRADDVTPLIDALAAGGRRLPRLMLLTPHDTSATPADASLR